MLENIKTPKDVKAMSHEEAEQLAKEIRDVILDTVSKNGGHLASNLGVVEATIVLHKCFDSPEDSILFDVGHQAYAHKLLTGRYSAFNTLRRFGGISGFTNPDESEHDKFFAGHSGTAIASAIGIAEANRLAGNERWTVAVVGDGSMTNGMVYEALNNCAEKNIRLIIILNDNEMSISPNVGGMSKYLAKARTSLKYFAFKDTLKKIFSSIPLVGKWLTRTARRIKEFVKRISYNKNVFESLGISYLGPIDGHDMKRLEGVIKHAKKSARPTIIHIITKKGAGYIPAVTEPQIYHSCASFDADRGVVPARKNGFSYEFGSYLEELASKDKRICAITAAMADGTGLSSFATKYPRRFFDVGIAEEYAITFASGLAKEGLLPVCALYSTFSQRVYDQLWHDISLQRLPMVLCLDRCGIVSGDGRTHQGIFDYSILTSVPGITVYSPETYEELRSTMDNAVSSDSLSVIRYPKGKENEYDRSGFTDVDGAKEYNTAACDVLIITYGAITENAYRAAQLLSGKVKVGILKLVRIFPLNEELIEKACRGKKLVYILEEAVASGSVGEKISAIAARRRFSVDNIAVRAVEEGFLPCGSMDELLEYCHMTPEQISGEIEGILRGQF